MPPWSIVGRKRGTLFFISPFSWGQVYTKDDIDKPFFNITWHGRIDLGDLSISNKSLIGLPLGRPLKKTATEPIFENGWVRGFLLGVSTLFFIAFFVFPLPAHAGFFDVLKYLFSGSDVGASNETAAASVSLPLLGSSGASGADVAANDDTALISATQDSALVSTRNPAGTLPRSTNDQISVYAVQEGDTPGSIAERFGISLNTLLWANNIRNAKNIRIGDELIILPVTGVQYEVKKGDTAESIARKFKADAGDIMSFNGFGVDEPLIAGAAIIIPDGEFTSTPSAPSGRPPSRFANLPEFSGYYTRPVIGGRNVRATRVNPHGLHGLNGVDLANSCGLPVFASADGTVIIARNDGWNGGYGKYIVVAHTNGTQTLYGHLSVILASAGQNVDQGSQIAAIGSSGNSTGCHLHFEVRGARNPF